MLERSAACSAHVGRLVRSCHERWDGDGYPDGLAGEEIPLVARIVCACDAFSAMTTDRPYRAARTDEEALAELVRCAGTQFDPDVVDALVRVVEPASGCGRTSRRAAAAGSSPSARAPATRSSGVRRVSSVRPRRSTSPSPSRSACAFSACSKSVRAKRALPNDSSRSALAKIARSASSAPSPSVYSDSAAKRPEDRDELVGRVVGEVDLAREARAQPGVRLEEPPHQPRVAGDDHDEPVAVVLHPLEQRLDRLVAEVEPLARRARARTPRRRRARRRAPCGRRARS